MLLIISGTAGADDQQRDCLEGEGSAGTSACEILAGRLSADLPRLEQLANRLEDDHRFDAALSVFAVARKYYPGDRTALQGFIRNRSAARQLHVPSVQLVLPQREAQPKPQSLCWVENSETALLDCREALAVTPNKASLHERIGDILRSRGSASDALRAYQRALSDGRGDDALITKTRALQDLVRAADSPTELPREPSGDNESGVVAQLELLEDLRTRRLIEVSEYDQRRLQILDGALTGGVRTRVPDAIDPSPPVIEKIDRRPFGRYLALVIGNERYKNQQRLRTPVNDAVAISELLSRDYGFEVTTLKNANRYDMAKALSDLRKDSRPNDNVLIYFAGHGFLDEVTRRGYWLPVDADADNYANWISTSDVTDTLAAIPARHAMVIADSCFSGSLLRSVGRVSDTIQRLKDKKSRTVITSGGLEPVLDGARTFGNKKHSVFANALLSALRANRQPIEAGRIFLEVRDVVSNNAEQTPQYAPIRNAGHDGGDFIFVPEASVCDELQGDCWSPTD